MSYCYFACAIERDKNKLYSADAQSAEYRPGYYADIYRIGENENVVSALSAIAGLKCAHVFRSKSDAAKVVELWNDSFKRNGTYLFE